MKQIPMRNRFYMICVAISMSLVGCNQASQEESKEAPITPVVTQVVSGDGIYNKAYETYNKLNDFAVVINSPTQEDIQELAKVPVEYEYDKNATNSILVIPKYNGMKVTVGTIEYTGERFIMKEELYSEKSTPEGYALLIKANRPESVAKIGVFITYNGKSVEHIIDETTSSNREVDYLQVETELPTGDLIQSIPDADTYLQGLNCHNRCEMDIDNDGSMETVEVYYQGDIDDKGHLLLDDGQEWALILRKGEEIYPLFGRNFIQLGGLEYVIYEDFGDYNRTHILITYQTGAAMMYYDCTYDEESGFMSRKSLFEANNINKLQEWSYKNCG